MHYLSKLFLSSWIFGFLGTISTHNIVFPAALYCLLRFGPVYKYFDVDREMEEQVHIHISAFSLVWLGSFAAIPLIQFTKRKPLIRIGKETLEQLFFYITLLFLWLTTDFYLLVQYFPHRFYQQQQQPFVSSIHSKDSKQQQQQQSINDINKIPTTGLKTVEILDGHKQRFYTPLFKTSHNQHNIYDQHNFILIEWLKNTLIVITIVSILLQLWYSRLSRQNVLWFANILFHSLYIHIIADNYVHLVFITPFIYALCLIKFSQLEFKIIFLSFQTIFIYNIIFFLNNEERYRYVFISSIVASIIVTTLFTLLLFLWPKEKFKIKINY